MSGDAIDQIIDLDRYPIDQLNSPIIKDLIKTGKQTLNDSALYTLEDFIQPEIAVKMTKELEELLPNAVRYSSDRNVYAAGKNDNLPDDHPRNQTHPCAFTQVLNYQIPNDSLLRKVYYWQPLTEFLRTLCGYDTLFRSECPHLALTIKSAAEGNTDGWHFDTNDVTFSILLQASEQGGAFEYAPYLCSKNEENTDAVSAIIKSPEQLAIRPTMGIGNLTVFKGDVSLHRVTPVIGNRNRIVALFSYDQKSGTSFSQAYIQELQRRIPVNR